MKKSMRFVWYVLAVIVATCSVVGDLLHINGDGEIISMQVVVIFLYCVLNGFKDD